MITRLNRGSPAGARSKVLAALALAALLTVPPARAAGAPAEGGSDQPPEGWKKVLAFGHCAANVFRAVTPADWAIAVFDCTRLFLEEPPLPGGGQP
jgi:hypothetical protein